MVECVRLLEKGSLNINSKTIAPNCPNGSGKKCDTIFLLDNGELKAQGTFDKLIQVSDKFRENATKDL